jgi:hypothetical protein
VPIAVAVGIVLLVLGAVGAYAYDSSRDDEIASGVKVGRVDVGGLSRDEAARLLRHQLVEPLRRPIDVTFNERTFRLTAKALNVHADVDGMVDDAIEAGRTGGLPGRTWRYITGDPVDETVLPEVEYSSHAVDRFVRHVADEVDQEPQDATVSPTGYSLNVVPAENGRTLKRQPLRRRIESLLDRGRSRRLVRATAIRTKPDVSTKEVASKYPSFLTLDRAGYTLRLWKNLKLVTSYTVAVGQQGLETPEGLYHIESKEVDPVWHVPESSWAGSLAGQDIPPGPSNPLKARWMGIFAGAGIHGTDQTWSLGQAVSHGCVRMSIPDVEELYDQVDVGTPIYIG